MIFLVIASLLSITIFIWQLSNIVSIIYGVPYVTIDKKVIRKALELSNLKKNEIFYDLGCGKGDVLLFAAKIGAVTTGFEISPYYYIYSKIRVFYHNKRDGLYNKMCSSVKSRKIKVKFQNIYTTDLSKVDVVYCYLLPKMMEKLALKFKKELRKNCRIISISFPIKNLELLKKAEFNNRKIFIYKI